MWHGLSARYHPNTIIFLRGLKTSSLNQEPCKVRSFNLERQRWVVRPLSPALADKDILVKEEHISLFSFILPVSVAPCSVLCNVENTEEKCNCSGGRGLVVSEGCSQGQVVFEEPPYLLSSSGSVTTWRSWSRWYSYSTMKAAAQTDPAMHAALQAFDRQTCGNFEPGRMSDMQEEVTKLLAVANKGGGAAADDSTLRALSEAHADEVSAVLQKVQSNQFRFHNGAGREASALYRLASLMNHSCQPNVCIEFQWGAATPGTLVSGDGNLLVRCLRDLVSDEALCYNYGPPELLSWALARRQDYLLNTHGFLCICNRCAADSALLTHLVAGCAAGSNPGTSLPFVETLPTFSIHSMD